MAISRVGRAALLSRHCHAWSKRLAWTCIARRFTWQERWIRQEARSPDRPIPTSSTPAINASRGRCAVLIQFDPLQKLRQSRAQFIG